MLLYFSGTGNSRDCAERLAERLGEECLDLGPYLRSGEVPELHSMRPWVLVCPTYAWQIPHLVRDLLRRIKLQGSRELYFIMTCGGDFGNAAAKNEALCRELGLSCRGTAEIVMPENYIALFDAPAEEEAKRIVTAAQPALERAAAAIAAGEKLLPTRRVTLVDKLKSGPVNGAFYPLVVRDRAFLVSDACIHCESCVEHCPTQNLRMEAGKPVWGGNCTHCMACICGCPVGAIEYGKASLGKPRYQCPKREKS